jgi:hypothetical protein
MSKRLRWDDIPDGASIAISKKSAMEMRGGGPKTFFSGMVCGAVCLLMLQSCGSDDSSTDKPNPKPSPSASASHKPAS